MITPQSKVVETRRYLKWATQWKEISAKCIAEKKFLILTPCIGYDGKVEYYPTESQWRSVIEDCVVKLLSYGGNKYNCYIAIINEIIRYCKDINKALWYVNIATDQVKGRLKVGAGCDELVYREYYNRLCADRVNQKYKFDILVIHIQSACDTEAKLKSNTEFAKNLADQYKLPIDCNEAGWSDVATLAGYNHLKMQMSYAEKIKCANFCNVFNNLERSAFNEDTKSWDFLCFKINGKLRSKYFTDWVGLMESEAPVPNTEGEDMILDKIYNIGSKGIGVRFIQMVLNEDIKPDPLLKVDGWWGSKTNAIVLRYQQKYNLSQYGGAIGANTMQQMIGLYPGIWNKTEYLWAIGVR